MSTISQFIQQEIILPRLLQHEVLVVYDPNGRYLDLCLDLANDKIQVVDASESSLEARLQALNLLQTLGQPNNGLEGLLVYVPAAAPLSDEDKQQDPFALYGACGAVFPDPTNDGDQYLSLCLKAKPDHATEIRRIFSQDSNPSFAVIDAIGGKGGWPTLQTLLKVESAREMLLALLAPQKKQSQALADNKSWLAEAKDLFKSTLGLTLTTKLESWEPVAEELWRFVLFSEFAFDLPDGPPESLSNVPRAPLQAKTLVFDLCEHLRNDQRTRSTYIERAEAIERELDLFQHCKGIDDFGERDTFPFEEQAGFRRAVTALRTYNMDLLHIVLGRHARSVWTERGENTIRWGLVQAAAALVQAVQDAERELPQHVSSPKALIDFYTTSLREIDRCQREFEQAATYYILPDEEIDGLKTLARGIYTRLANAVQEVFLKHVEKVGWPLSEFPANRDSFDRLVTPALKQSGHRIAVLLIDALRYELGVELSKQLSDLGQVEIKAACAQLPTITPVGMASLLPKAAAALYLKKGDGDRLCVLWENQSLANVSQRMAVLQRQYGQRFHEIPLNDFIKQKKKIDPTVELLVLRSNEMDNDFETNPEAAPSLIGRTFQKVGAALHKLRHLGFHEAFLLTDHGFYLNPAPDAADVCSSPPGNWLNVHERMLLGDGTEDAANLVLPAERLGIPGDFAQAAVPRALVAYRAGQTYFHGGLSLQEAIVPVIHILLHSSEAHRAKTLEVTLSYKQGTKKITTRLPVIEVIAGQQPELFDIGEVALVIEAYDEAGKVVGEAKPGGVVNPTDRVIRLKSGERAKVTLRMDMSFEGRFTVKALDPNTQVAVGKPLELETDYTV